MTARGRRIGDIHRPERIRLGAREWVRHGVDSYRSNGACAYRRETVTSSEVVIGSVGNEPVRLSWPNTGCFIRFEGRTFSLHPQGLRAVDVRESGKSVGSIRPNRADALMDSDRPMIQVLAVAGMRFHVESFLGLIIDYSFAWRTTS